MEADTHFPLWTDVTKSSLSSALAAKRQVSVHWNHICASSGQGHLRPPPLHLQPRGAGPRAQEPSPTHTRTTTLTELVSPHNTHSSSHHISGGSVEKLVSTWMISNMKVTVQSQPSKDCVIHNKWQIYQYLYYKIHIPFNQLSQSWESVSQK